MRTFAHLSASNSETRAPVSAASVNSVLYGLAGRGNRLLELAALEQPALRALPGLRPLGGQQERDRVGSGPAETPRRVPVDPIHDADDNHDRRLGKPVGTQLPDERREIVRRNRVEAMRGEAPHQVLLHRIAVAGLRRGPEIHHRTLEPLRRRIAEAQSSVGCDSLATRPADEQLVANCTGGGDSAIDGSPPLPAGSVLEADLVHARRPAVDIPLHAHTTGSGAAVICGRHCSCRRCQC